MVQCRKIESPGLLLHISALFNKHKNSPLFFQLVVKLTAGNKLKYEDMCLWFCILCKVMSFTLVFSRLRKGMCVLQRDRGEIIDE